jgi:hypothetical protein
VDNAFWRLRSVTSSPYSLRHDENLALIVAPFRQLCQVETLVYRDVPESRPPGLPFCNRGAKMCNSDMIRAERHPADLAQSTWQGPTG